MCRALVCVLESRFVSLTHRVERRAARQATRLETPLLGQHCVHFKRSLSLGGMQRRRVTESTIITLKGLSKNCFERNRKIKKKKKTFPTQQRGQWRSEQTFSPLLSRNPS